jgi:hypothetical protein
MVRMMSGAGDFCQCVAGDAKRHGVWLPYAAFDISFCIASFKASKAAEDSRTA